MRIVGLALAFFLIGAAPPEVPIGKYQTWLSSKNVPLNFRAGEVKIHVEALPCPANPVGDSSCRWEGYNNQAAVTVSAPGVVPLTVKTDSQSSYARIAVVRFDRRDPRAGVIVESQSGGSAGDMWAQLLIPRGGRYQALSLGDHSTTRLQGQIADGPRDMSGDGRIDLELEDGSFDHVFACNACSPRPPRLFAVKDGMVVDESRDPALRHVFAADMIRWKPICLSKARDRNGFCAAYVADAARAGHFDKAWAAMLAHYEHDGNLWEPCRSRVASSTNYRCPPEKVKRFRNFPESLRAFLIRTGYLPS